MRVAALVLAAGGSARLGQPKQLLPYDGSTLVRRAAEAALAAGCSPVLVVLGRERAAVAAALADLPIDLVPNELWERGIGSSIRAGLAALPKVDAVVILTCDQPAVTVDVLDRLLAAHAQRKNPIVASAYADTLGTPALFAQKFFAALRALPDAEGAKTIITTHLAEVQPVAFPEGAIDIDTPEDYRNLTDPERKMVR